MHATCGIDWAEDHHDAAVVDADAGLLAKLRISDDAAAFQNLLRLLAEHGDSPDDPIPVAIETSRGLLVACLRATGRRVYAINPMAVARYRDLVWNQRCQVMTGADDGVVPSQQWVRWAGVVSGIGLDVAVSVYEVIRQLSEISIVRDRSRAMAMVDAIMSPDWEARFYSFDSRWSLTEEMASMRDGCGNEYSIVFSPAGAYARGFDHESPMSPYRVTPPALWPGLFGRVPEAFLPQVTEPAFSEVDGTPRATVCFWREQADIEWKCGAVQALPEGVEDDGSAEWLFDVLLDGRPEAYQQFAEEHYEVAVSLQAVRHVYALRPLTQSVVSSLNPDVDLASLVEDIAQIGYPLRG